MAFALVGEDPVTDELLDGFHEMEDAGVSRIVMPRLLDANREHAVHSLQRLADELLERYSILAQEHADATQTPFSPAASNRH